MKGRRARPLPRHTRRPFPPGAGPHPIPECAAARHRRCQAAPRRRRTFTRGEGEEGPQDLPCRPSPGQSPPRALRRLRAAAPPPPAPSRGMSTVAGSCAGPAAGARASGPELVDIIDRRDRGAELDAQDEAPLLSRDAGAGLVSPSAPSARRRRPKARAAGVTCGRDPAIPAYPDPNVESPLNAPAHLLGGRRPPNLSRRGRRSAT
jgi:hypothetical protein